MQLKFYSINCDKRLVDKSAYLTQNNLLQNFTDVVLKNDCSLTNPIFQIYIGDGLSFQDSLSKINNSNYVNFYANRLENEIIDNYYFITDVKHIKGNLVEVSCHMDVLHTNRIGIRNMRCIIERQEKEYNSYLSDDYYHVQNRKRIQAFPLDNDYHFNDANFYLTLAGGL